MVEMGRATTAPDYLDAQHATLDLARGLEEWFDSGYDLLLTPTMGEPPCPLGEFHTPDDAVPRIHARRDDRSVHPAGQHGRPARDLGTAELERRRDCPIGSQLMAAYGREDVLVRVASQLETARPWADRRPPVHV